MIPELEYSTLALLNMLFGGVTAAGCICRLSIGSPSTVRRIVRVKYVTLLVGSLVSALSPLLFPFFHNHGWPGPGHVLLSLCVCVATAAEWDRWRYAPPEDVRPEVDNWDPESGQERRQPHVPDRRRYH